MNKKEILKLIDERATKLELESYQQEEELLRGKKIEQARILREIRMEVRNNE